MGDPNMEFSDTDFQITMVLLFKEIEGNLKNFTKEVDFIKKKYMEMLCLVNKITEVKNSVGKFNSSLDTVEKRISKLKGR